MENLKIRVEKSWNEVKKLFKKNLNKVDIEELEDRKGKVYDELLEVEEFWARDYKEERFEVEEIIKIIKEEIEEYLN